MLAQRSALRHAVSPNKKKFSRRRRRGFPAVAGIELPMVGAPFIENFMLPVPEASSQRSHVLRSICGTGSHRAFASSRCSSGSTTTFNSACVSRWDRRPSRRIRSTDDQLGHRVAGQDLPAEIGGSRTVDEVPVRPSACGRGAGNVQAADAGACCSSMRFTCTSNIGSRSTSTFHQFLGLAAAAFERSSAAAIAPGSSGSSADPSAFAARSMS